MLVAPLVLASMIAALPALAPTAAPEPPKWEDMILHGLVGSYATISIVDMRQTTIAIDAGIVREGNPVLAYVIEKSGTGGLTAAKIAATIGVSAVLEYAWHKAERRRDRWFVIAAAAAAVTIQALVVESNTQVMVTGTSFFF